MSRIIRHAIPVDDQFHEFEIPVGMNAILQVACRRRAEVDIWVVDDPSIPTRTAVFRVIGTGHEIARGERWVGTCVAPDNFLVWHLMELMEKP
jgi:hypothetical protein